MKVQRLSCIRKGIGSIIGGVFLMLIFSTIMTSFFVIDNAQKNYYQELNNRKEFDNKKGDERIEYIDVSVKDNNFLNVTIRNNGNIGTEVVYIGKLGRSTSDSYYQRIDIFVNPMETISDISSNFFFYNNTPINLVLLTKFGNIYYYEYDSSNEDTYYSLTISVNGMGLTNPSEGMYIFPDGQFVQVSANYENGWILDHWLLDGVDIGNMNSVQIGMDSDHSLEAFFTESTDILLSDSFNDFDNWDLTNWLIKNDEWHSKNTSAGSDRLHQGRLVSKTVDSSNATSLNVQFYYRLSTNVDPTDVEVFLFDGLGGPDSIGYLQGERDTWNLFNFTTLDSQYFVNDLYIRIDSNLDNNEYIWIDDLTITIN